MEIYQKMERVPGFLTIYIRLINKRSIGIKTKKNKEGEIQLAFIVKEIFLLMCLNVVRLIVVIYGF
jgi:hypothetical protein